MSMNGMVSASKGVVRSVGRRTIYRDLTNMMFRSDCRVMASCVEKANGNCSSRRLNALAKMINNASNYCEIGIDKGYTLEAVDILTRVGVDPNPKICMSRLPTGVSVRIETSDAFFNREDLDSKFDLYFIDGLHTYDQVYRDIVNCFQHSYPWSVVVVDDVVPADRIAAIRDLNQSRLERKVSGSKDLRWHGDVYRVMLLLHQHHPELQIRTVGGDGENEQAIMWHGEATGGVRKVGDDVVSSYSHYSYEDVFSQGIPYWFHVSSEKVVLEEIRQWLNKGGG